jgi:hypothetical protein
MWRGGVGAFGLGPAPSRAANPIRVCRVGPGLGAYGRTERCNLFILIFLKNIFYK